MTAKRMPSLIAVLVLACGIGSTRAADAGEQVPFKGYFVPAITLASDVSCSNQFLTIWVTGQATHLGSFAGPATACLDPVTLSYTGSFRWYSPNGRDSVQGTFSGYFDPIDPPFARNVEDVWITGGTGRFSGAEGYFTAGGVFNLATLAPAPAPFEGEISRPHPPQ